MFLSESQRILERLSSTYKSHFCNSCFPAVQERIAPEDICRWLCNCNCKNLQRYLFLSQMYLTSKQIPSLENILSQGRSCHQVSEQQKRRSLHDQPSPEPTCCSHTMNLFPLCSHIDPTSPHTGPDLLLKEIIF